MNIRYIAQGTDWTDKMKDRVQQTIALPLQRSLKGTEFDLSVHLMVDKSETLTMWIVLQTFDGRGNQVVRRKGGAFKALALDVSNQLRRQMRKVHGRRRLSLNLFDFLTFARTA